MEVTTNNVIKVGVVNGLKLIPVAGGCLSGMVGAFWPEDHTNPLADLQAQVNQLPVVIADNQRITTLNDTLHGLQDVALAFKNSQAGHDTYNNFSALYNFTTDKRYIFTEVDDIPGRSLPYLVAYGSLRLGVLSERARHYQQMLGDAPSNPLQLRGEFYNELSALMDLVTDANGRAQDARLKCLTISSKDKVVTSADEGGGGLPGTAHHYTVTTWTVTDTADGTHRDFVDWMNPSSPQPKALANRFYRNRLFDISTSETGYCSQLDNATDAIRYWKFLSGENDNKPYPPPPGLYFFANRFGDGMMADIEFNHRANYEQGNGNLSRIDFWWTGDGLKGLEVYYGGVSSGLLGVAVNPGGRDIVPLADGEHITWLSGTAGESSITTFALNTNARINAGTGPVGFGPGGGYEPATIARNPMLAAPPGAIGIAYFGGVAGPSGISQLKVVWKRDIDYTESLGTENTVEALDVVDQILTDNT